MPGGSPEHYYGRGCVGAALGLCANTKGGVCVASLKHHRLASTSIALLLYLRHCPPSLARHSTIHLQLLRNGTGCTPSPTLGLARHVRCDPDHPSPPPWAPLLITTTKSPKALHPAGLRQHTLALVALCSSQAACLYHTEGWAGGGGTGDTCLVCVVDDWNRLSQQVVSVQT